MGYVYKRSNGFFEIRYPISSDVVSYFPKPNGKSFKTHTIKSLGTRDQQETNKVVIDCAREIEGTFSFLRDGSISFSKRRTSFIRIPRLRHRQSLPNRQNH
ncbi:MAG: hypothetical protein CMF04_08170 [Hyphomonas sp.]|nr:hypothetical protein [Hyphomonas sp.]